MLAVVYYIRCFDFGKYYKDDTIPMKLYLDVHRYNIHLTYLGRENISSSFGKLMCIKFEISLISGKIFKPEEQITICATDDNNRLPVYMEAPVLIGSVSAELQLFSNLRNPTDAKVK